MYTVVCSIGYNHSTTKTDFLFSALYPDTHVTSGGLPKTFNFVVKVQQRSDNCLSNCKLVYCCPKPKTMMASQIQKYTVLARPGYLEVGHLILQSLIFTLEVSKAVFSLAKLRLQLCFQLSTPFLELLQLLLGIMATRWYTHTYRHTLSATLFTVHHLTLQS